MMFNVLLLATAISAVSLLWRIFSRHDFIKNKIEYFPYVFKKPLTCGVCFTFWLTLAALLIFTPFDGWQLPLRWSLGFITDTAIFITHWFILGMGAVFLYYVFLTFYEGSHYLAHKAESLHQK